MDIDLCGEYKLYREGEYLTDVVVPGSVLSGLLDAGIIENPFYRDNEFKVRRELYYDYSFERKFEYKDEGKWYDLVFEGIDTKASVYLNGVKILDADNMFRKYVVNYLDIRDALKDGENVLRVDITSPFTPISNHKNAPGKEISYVSTGVLPGAQYMRKAGSDFGWDWGPQLPDMGIWKKVYLRENKGALIESVQVRQEHLEDKVNLNISLDIETLEDVNLDDISVRCDAYSPEGDLIVSEIKAADLLNEITVPIANPELWWPRGYGEQPLYKVDIKVCGLNNHNVDNATNDGENLLCERSMRVGLRTMTVNTDAIDDGSDFSVTVNGVKVFLMGANYIPEDVIYSRINEDTYKRLIDAAIFANYNCLRVWGGGYYPSDEFLDLLDENGIILWQDLMFACLIYEVDDEFLRNVTAEVAQNIGRIALHPCLGVIAGNNEMEYAWGEWEGYRDHPKALKEDYVRLFEKELLVLVKDIAPDTYYQPSCPSKGGGFKNLNQDNAGDTHYWEVWHGEVPFTYYEKHLFRMCSEFGFQSFPEMKTIMEYEREEDMNIFSVVSECHQKNPAANGKVLKYLSDNFRLPKDYENLLYVSQILQALALRTAVDHFRRNRGDCMGALYWQINDNWPVASWSTVDYYGRYKAAHYFAKKFYSPVSVSLKIESAGYEVDKPIVSFEEMRAEREMVMSGRMPATYSLKGYVVNETREDRELDGCLKVIDMNFNEMVKQDYELEVQELYYTSTDVFELPEEVYLKRRDVISVFEANEQMTDDSDKNMYQAKPLVPYKELNLLDPEISMKAILENGELLITLSAKKIALFVALSSDECDLVFSDNYFDILSADEVVVKADRLDGIALDHVPGIKVCSLYDSF